MLNPENAREIADRFEPMIKDLGLYELLELNKLVVGRIRLIQKAGALISISNFRVGEEVSWEGRNGEIHSGTVIRLNQQTVSVKTDDDGHWNVPPQLLMKKY